jgi:multifunctional methyltransferase subunit TRM112
LLILSLHFSLHSSAASDRTTKGYPLIVKPKTVILEEAPLDVEMIRRILSRIDYNALKEAYLQISDVCVESNIEVPSLPEAIPLRLVAQQNIVGNLDEFFDDDADIAALKHLFRALFEIHVIEGFLVCPDTGREFPIRDGIPNMILHEDEL